MATRHEKHDHKHGPGCGHTAIKHDGHVDYLHDGHLHHVAQGGVEEHQLEVSGTNPAVCTPNHKCGGHDRATSTAPAAATRPSRTATTSITWSMATCTTRTASTATTTARSRRRECAARFTASGRCWRNRLSAPGGDRTRGRLDGKATGGCDGAGRLHAVWQVARESAVAGPSLSRRPLAC